MRELAPDAEDRNYTKTPLIRVDVEDLLDAAGSVASVMNTRHATAKDRGWKDDPPDRALFVDAVLAEPNLLKRPIVIRDGRSAVGSGLGAIRALLSETPDTRPG